MEFLYKDYIVPKPWGEEYLVFENDNIGIWLLKIKKNESTSLHCHPDKKTSLILLDGNIDVSFLNDSVKMNKFSKMIIREGFFHSTRAKRDSYLLEVETPKIKDNLVRMEDEYGRKGKSYESPSNYIKRTDDTLWIEDKEKFKIKFKQFEFSVKRLSKKLVNSLDDTDLIIVLGQVGIKTKYGLSISKVGDTINVFTFKRLLKDFSVAKNCRVLIIRELR